MTKPSVVILIHPQNTAMKHKTHQNKIVVVAYLFPNNST